MDEEEDYSQLVPDEDEEIPETYLDDEEDPAESPLEVLGRCRENTYVEAFEDLKRGTESWLRGQLDSSEKLLELWQGLDQELAARHHYFQEGLRFQEWTEFLVVTGREVFEQFEWMGEQMMRFRESIGQELEMAYALEQIYAALVVLLHAYRTLQELQASLPALSDSPLVAELIRVGQLAAEQKIPAEAFAERVHVYYDMQERLRQALECARPAPRERAILEEERPHLEEGFAAQRQGVEELLHFADTLDRAHLERGIELLEQGAQVQLRLRDRLNQPEERACPFCGAGNDVYGRFCSRCSARLPEPATVSQETAPDAPGLSSNFQRLANAVQQRLRGQLDEDQFQETLRWFRNLYEGVCRQNKTQSPAPANTPPEQAQLLAQAQESMQSGLEMIEDGLSQLESGEYLEQGLETVIAGGDRLLEMEGWMQEAAQLADR